MRIPKILVLSAVAVLSTIGLLQAQQSDSDAQAKARDQLRQKMQELDSQQPGKPAPAPTPAPKPAPPAKPKPAAVQPAPAPAQAPVVKQTAPKPVPAPAPAPVAAQPAATQPMPIMAADPAVRAKAEEALRQKMMELDAQGQAGMPAPTVKPVAVKERPAQTAPKTQTAPNVATSKPPVYTPAPAPIATQPSSANSKEGRLADLLQKYRADQITPQEYHAQRAKILSEP